MTKEEKALFVMTMLPLIRDYSEDLVTELPNLWKQGLKKATNDFIREVDKISNTLTEDNSELDIEEVRKQYQDIYCIHLGISKEIFKK